MLDRPPPAPRRRPGRGLRFKRTARLAAPVPRGVAVPAVTALAMRAVALAVLAATVAGARPHGAHAETPDRTAEVLLPARAIQQLDAQLTDLGRPAFVDGVAGLLLVHAGRDPRLARAMLRHLLHRAPTATLQAARALRLAGFDPAAHGLGVQPRPSDGVPAEDGGSTAAAVQPGAAVAGPTTPADTTLGVQPRPGRGWPTRDDRPPGVAVQPEVAVPVPITPAGSTLSVQPGPGDRVLTEDGDATAAAVQPRAAVAVPITAAATLRPSVAGLATPQLR